MRHNQHGLSATGNALAAYLMLATGAIVMSAFGLVEFMSYLGGVIATIVAVAMVARGI